MIDLKWFFDSKKSLWFAHLELGILTILFKMRINCKKRWGKIDRVRIQLHARVSSSYGKDAKKLPGIESTKPYDSGVNPA